MNSATPIYPGPNLFDEVKDFVLDVATLPELFRNPDVRQGIADYVRDIVPGEIRKEVSWVGNLVKEGITCPYGLLSLLNEYDEGDLSRSVNDKIGLLQDYHSKLAENLKNKTQQTLDSVILYTAAIIGVGFLLANSLFKRKEEPSEEINPPNLRLVRG